MLTENLIAAMLADIVRAQDILQRPAPIAPGGRPTWQAGHASAWAGLEFVRAKLAQELKGENHATGI